jgi:hypothetical protein
LRSQPADEHFVERARRSSLAALSTMHRDLSASIGRGGGAHEPEVLRSETAMPMELPEPPALPVRPPTTWHRAARVVRRAQAGMKLDELDVVVPHQANGRIVEAIRSRLRLAEDRVWNDKRRPPQGGCVPSSGVSSSQRGKARRA